jgi:hypothetical protein
MDTKAAAVIFVTGTAIAGIVATQIQTSRLYTAKAKLHSTEAQLSFYQKAYKNSLGKMTEAAFEKHVDEVITQVKFDNITKNV